MTRMLTPVSSLQAALEMSPHVSQAATVQTDIKFEGNTRSQSLLLKEQRIQLRFCALAPLPYVDGLATTGGTCIQKAPVCLCAHVPFSGSS
jgi:hypothetical protein